MVLASLTLTYLKNPTHQLFLQCPMFLYLCHPTHPPLTHHQQSITLISWQSITSAILITLGAGTPNIQCVGTHNDQILTQPQTSIALAILTHLHSYYPVHHHSSTLYPQYPIPSPTVATHSTRTHEDLLL